jgi:hypothetical protein
MIATTSRFAELARWQALLIVAILIAAMAGGVAYRMHNKFLPGATSAIPTQSAPTLRLITTASGGMVLTNVPANADEVGDLALYRRVTLRMIDGASYYPAAADEHRNANYPLRPFITVRMPTLALIGSSLGLVASRAVLIVLVLLAGWAWWARLQHITNNKSLQPVICILTIAIGLATFVAAPNMVVSHEAWAALLMALSWALWGGFGELSGRSVRAWLPSVLLATAAVLIRETALPFVLLMGAFAVWRRQWVEVVGWISAALVFAVALALHAANVAAVISPADAASPGWANFGGWPFFVLAMHGATGLRIIPEWSAAIAVSLTMLGWASWRSDTGAFGFLLYAGYALIFMALGRPDNWYWGLLISPVFLLGLLFAPQAIADLVKVIRRRSPVSGVRAPATGKQWPTTSARPAAAR